MPHTKDRPDNQRSPYDTLVVLGAGSMGGPIVPSSSVVAGERLKFDAELGTPTTARLRERTLQGVLELLGPAGEALIARCGREDLECALRGLRLRATGTLVQGDWELRAPLAGGAGEPWIDTPHGQVRLGLLLQMGSLRGQMALRCLARLPDGEVAVKLLRARYVAPSAGWLSRPLPAQLRGDISVWGNRPLPRGLEPGQRRADAWPALISLRGHEVDFDLIWRAP